MLKTPEKPKNDHLKHQPDQVPSTEQSNSRSTQPDSSEISSDSVCTLRWRKPTLEEVLEYLSNPNDEIKLHASGYLQHLTYRNDVIKRRTRKLGGIPKLIALLSSEKSEIQRNACACLRNLAYAEPNDQNKIEIIKSGGVQAMAALLKRKPAQEVIDAIFGALWNMSSCDVSKTFI